MQDILKRIKNVITGEAKIDDLLKDISVEKVLQNLPEATGVLKQAQPENADLFQNRQMQIEYYAIKKRFAESDDEDRYVTEYHNRFTRWLAFTLDPQNRFYFGAYEIPPEAEVKHIIAEPGSDQDKTSVFTKFFKRPAGRIYLRQLIDRWFLPRYDLDGAKALVNYLMPEKSPDKNPKSRIFSLAGLFGGLLILLIISTFLTESAAGNASTRWFFWKNWHDWQSFSAVHWISFMLTGAVYAILSYQLFNICRTPLKLKLSPPRLIGGILVGYIPLLVGDQIWKVAFHVNWLIIVLLWVGCFIMLHIYFDNEIKKNLEDESIIPKRLQQIKIKAFTYAIVIGIFLMDLFGNAFIHIMGDAFAGIEAWRYPGFLGDLHLKMLAALIPLALIIGIMLQFIWEDKSITEAL